MSRAARARRQRNRRFLLHAGGIGLAWAAAILAIS